MWPLEKYSCFAMMKMEKCANRSGEGYGKERLV